MHKEPRKTVPLLNALASRRLSAILLIACMISMAVATIWEVRKGTPAAHYHIYGATWFEVLLFMLGVNLFAAIINRLRTGQLQLAFLFSHLSILLVLVGAFLTKHYAITGMVALPEGKSTHAIGLEGQEIAILSAGNVLAQQRLPSILSTLEMPSMAPPIQPMVAQDVQFTFEDYWPDIHRKVTVQEAVPPAPAIADLLLQLEGETLPIMVTETEGAMLGLLRLYLAHVDNPVPEPASGPAVIILFDNQETFLLRFIGENEFRTEIPCKLGEDVKSPWSTLTFTITRFWQHGSRKYHFEPAIPVTENPTPAIRVHAHKGEETQKFWLKQNNVHTLQPPFPPLALSLSNAIFPLGFDVALDSFEIQYYPGSPMPRSYSSRLLFPDSNAQGTVRLNHPVTHNGWSFFQADYMEEDENAPALSILSVSSDPGQRVIFAGYAGLLFGMLLLIVQRRKPTIVKTFPVTAAAILGLCLLCAAAPLDTGAPDGSHQFRSAWIFMLLGFLLCLLTIRKPGKPCFPVGVTFCLVATAILSWGLWIRWETAGRFPAANMYESLLFLGWGSGIFVLIALLFRECLACVTAAAIGTLSLLLADLLPLNHEIGPVAPILLDTPWMALHVPVTMAAYAVLGFATLLAHMQILRVARNRSGLEAVIRLDRLLNRYILVGACLLATGIITGSVWASVSWGRYWGWDSKEVWSLIACLGYLAIIHTKSRPFARALQCALAFWLIIMTYLGVNFVLRTGLHSYASDTGSITFWLKWAALADILFIIICSLIMYFRKHVAKITIQRTQ